MFRSARPGRAKTIRLDITPVIVQMRRAAREKRANARTLYPANLPLTSAPAAEVVQPHMRPTGRLPSPLERLRDAGRVEQQAARLADDKIVVFILVGIIDALDHRSSGGSSLAPTHCGLARVVRSGQERLGIAPHRLGVPF